MCVPSQKLSQKKVWHGLSLSDVEEAECCPADSEKKKITFCSISELFKDVKVS